jgi:hypothetical protein
MAKRPPGIAAGGLKENSIGTNAFSGKSLPGLDRDGYHAPGKRGR